MKLENGKFKISYVDHSAEPATVEKDALVIGRLQSCDVVLNHRSVSRIHAGINRVENEYFLINLSTSNSLTLNGKLLSAEEADVLADGDIIQIGPFTIKVSRLDNELDLAVLHQFTGDLENSTRKLPPLSQLMADRDNKEVAGVLKVFWEKRTREKEDWGTRLRPTEKPQPGKALINWKPTGDLQRPWRFGLFIWAFLIVGVLAVVAFYRYPQTYVSKPLSNPHIKKIDAKLIANRGNENSCTTCHALNEPMENSCIQCHQAEQFHATNTKAHEDAGVTCTVCHLEHQGENFEPRITAVQGCAECHNDNNKQLFNGLAVHTAHNGTFGNPAKDGEWIWEGLYSEIAETMPTVNASRVKDETEQMHRSRQFHALHLFRLTPAEGMRSDKSNRVSCSSCHNSFDPVDRVTPYETCATCHNGLKDQKTGRLIINEDKANCVSCHVQHPYSQNRWNNFLTNEAKAVREKVINLQIERLKEK
jgi:hypothetical protein